MYTAELVNGDYVSTPLGRLKVDSNKQTHTQIINGERIGYWRTVLVGVDSQWCAIGISIKSAGDYPWDL